MKVISMSEGALSVQISRHAFILRIARDRKSTRLNSSHLGISYAVFCLKKKRRCVSTQATCPNHHLRRTPVAIQRSDAASSKTEEFPWRTSKSAAGQRFFVKHSTRTSTHDPDAVRFLADAVFLSVHIDLASDMHFIHLSVLQQDQYAYLCRCRQRCKNLHPHQIRLFYFFFNDTATTEIYTLSLHDALPI